jgi:hypothetical protein
MAPINKLSKGQLDAINNEAHLVRYMAYSGLSALRRAEFQQLGSYFEAFFAITVSYERATKLVLALDTYLATGAFPTDGELRAYGHNLVRLEERVASVVEARSLPVLWKRPIRDLDVEVLNFLNDFASAGQDRYYNLNYLGALQGGASYDGPPGKWMALIKKHLKPAQLKLTRREEQGIAMQAWVDSRQLTIVRHSKEDGSPISTMEAAQAHSYLNQRVQRVGTLACIQHLRFAIEVLRRLGDEARALEVPDFVEYFSLILNSDEILKSRKRFR